MRCTCSECRGEGTITCPDCNGNGGIRGRIECINLADVVGRTHPHYEELVELQKDARRVMQQCNELKILLPQFAEKYEAQMNAVVDGIDKQAEKLAESI